jgi:hypothetical protein
MTRIRLIMLSLLAVFAFSAVATTAAEAITAPFYRVPCHKVITAGTGAFKDAACTEPGGTNEYDTRLLAGEEREVIGKQVLGKSYVLKAGGDTITCTAQKLKAGAKLIGSAKNEPGTSTETIEFSGCTVAGNGEGCEVKGKAITTEPVKNVLDYYSKEIEKAKFSPEYIGTYFVPVTGTRFVKIEFEPTPPCEVASTEVTGGVEAEDVSSTGAKVGPSGVEPKEKVARVRFPTPPILLYETVTKEAGTVHELTATSKPTWLTAFGGKATLTGESELELPGVAEWGVFSK